MHAYSDVCLNMFGNDCMLADKQQRRALVELHHKDQTNKGSMENLVYGEMQQRNAVKVHQKEQTNKDSVENTVYEGIQQRGSKTKVEVRHKEQTDKDSVENPVYESMQQRSKTEWRCTTRSKPTTTILWKSLYKNRCRYNIC